MTLTCKIEPTGASSQLRNDLLANAAHCRRKRIEELAVSHGHTLYEHKQRPAACAEVLQAAASHGQAAAVSKGHAVTFLPSPSNNLVESVGI